ncbi:hypothetical protein [Oceanobacillus polygoni]|uniref:Uncharacterized protein n=1 Tax=Oceanobacillus polygoni TaxID=1235259 RepID=A0A9X0YS02_9BACI|nr:hypothetical protein [Oceanobacillus polygoni]MBP2077016.1 hypothetical protein [Oceanobacillus polygoni]
MKKYVVLFIYLTTIFGYSYFVIDGQLHHHFVMEQGENISNNASTGFHPTDDGKQKISIIKLEFLQFLFLSSPYLSHFFIRLIRRIMVLTPVFYQSNYVIKPLLIK